MPLPMLLLVAALQDAPQPCKATVEWVHDDRPQQLTASRTQVRPLVLFSTVSRACTPGTLTVDALYFDSDDNLICSGTIGVADQPMRTQTTLLEFKLTSLFEFVRWRSGPAATGLRWKSFECARPDGIGNVQPAELERASAVRLSATILAGGDGLATDSVRLVLGP